ncbi:MAG: hypothetical protein V3V00_14825 [Saprospiraceae bacterium]
MKHLLTIIILVSIGTSCTVSEPIETISSITQLSDYQSFVNKINNTGYLDSLKNRKVDEITFWDNQVVQKGDVFLYNEKIGKLLAEKFEITGDINDIRLSNKHFLKAAKQTSGNYKSSMLLSLSSNHIKLHQFEKAKQRSTEAYHLAHNKTGPALMVYDAILELGDYDYAQQIMEQYSDLNSFDYLVRFGKYMDHTGDLDAAIIATESAYEKVKLSQKSNRNWILTHLADMYGHDGRIQKSYETYLEVLRKNPSNLHALKGIAWIAFSHDRDYNAAYKILNVIKQSTSLPDAYLWMAEVAEAENKMNKKQEYIRAFKREVTHQNLNDLYSIYIADLLLENKSSRDQALHIAEIENKKRKTPETFTLLAKAHNALGHRDITLQILEKHVIGYSFEPSILFHCGMMLLENGDEKRGKRMLEDAKEAAFELGPAVMQKIESMI